MHGEASHPSQEYERAIAGLRNLGLPVQYILGLTAYLENPDPSKHNFATPEPFSSIPEEQQMYYLHKRGVAFPQIVEHFCRLPDPSGSPLKDYPEEFRSTVLRRIEHFIWKRKRLPDQPARLTPPVWNPVADLFKEELKEYAAERQRQGVDGQTLRDELPIVRRLLVFALQVYRTLRTYPGGRIPSAPLEEHFTCARGHPKERMRFSGMGIRGWIYECPICGHQRIKSASKEELGLARGTRVRRWNPEFGYEEHRGRYIAAIGHLCPEGRGNRAQLWDHLATILDYQGIHLSKPDGTAEHVTDVQTLYHLWDKWKGVFNEADRRRIYLEAKGWTDPF